MIEIKNLFTIGNRDKRISDIDKVSLYLIDAGKARYTYASNWNSLGTRIAAFLTINNPKAEGIASEISTIFSKLSNIETDLASQEVRNGENFHDVQERYEVYFRYHEEYLIAKEKYQQASLTYVNAVKADQTASSKSNYEKQRPKLQAAIDKAKEGKKQAADKYRQSLLNVMKNQKKYMNFKVRRLRDGWTRYGNALKQHSESQTQLFLELRKIIQKIHTELGASAASQVAEQITEQINSEPDHVSPAEIEKDDDPVSNENQEEEN